MFIFHNVTITYPTNFTQCTTRGSFITHWQETAYNMFTFSCLFLLPLVIMIVCYTRIFIQISKRMTRTTCKFTAEADVCWGENAWITFIFMYLMCLVVSDSSSLPVSSKEPHLRCSKNNIPKARMRTLKMSIVIVIGFIVCWTPYYLLGLWYWFFPDHLEGKVSHSLTHILFIFGLFNACLDPIIYGLFTIRFCKGLRSCYRKAAVMSDKQPNTVLTESLKCTALPSKRGMTADEKGRDCEHAEIKSTADRCLTVFSQGEGGQPCFFNPESTVWWDNGLVESCHLLYISQQYLPCMCRKCLKA